MPKPKPDAIDTAGLAALLGVKPATIRQYRYRGILPAPDGTISRGPFWWPATIERWRATQRRGPGQPAEAWTVHAKRAAAAAGRRGARVRWGPDRKPITRAADRPVEDRKPITRAADRPVESEPLELEASVTASSELAGALRPGAPPAAALRCLVCGRHTEEPVCKPCRGIF